MKSTTLKTASSRNNRCTHIKSVTFNQESLRTDRRGRAGKTHFSYPHPNHVLCDCQFNICFEYLMSVTMFIWLLWLQTATWWELSQTGMTHCVAELTGYLFSTWQHAVLLQPKKTYREKRRVPISAAHTDRNTHCVTLGASRLRSASLLTIARSPPRSIHCCRASVQLISPGTIWKQCEDSAWYTPSFGQ